MSQLSVYETILFTQSLHFSRLLYIYDFFGFFVYEQWDGPLLTGEKQFESSAELLSEKYSNCFDKPNAGPSRDTYR